MTVTKTTRECYEVRDGKPHGEWANITLHCWDRKIWDDSTYYCGEITIQSSFGTWGYIWTACSKPFKEFLCDIEFDYAFGKFMGASLSKFDGEGSMRGLRAKVIEHRRHGWISKEDARAIWESLAECEEEATCSENDWVHALSSAGSDLHDDGHTEAAKMLEEPWELFIHKPQPCAVNFWRELWPLFIDALKAEQEPLA